MKKEIIKIDYCFCERQVLLLEIDNNTKYFKYENKFYKVFDIIKKDNFAIRDGELIYNKSKHFHLLGKQVLEMYNHLINNNLKSFVIVTEIEVKEVK